MTESAGDPSRRPDRGKTVHGEAANAGHRVLAPDDAEVEAYLETALNAPAPDRRRHRRPAGARPSRRHRRRPRLRQPVRPADRAPRPRARRLLRAAAARHARAPSWSGAAPGRSSCRAARTPSTTTARPSPTRRSGAAASRSSASATGPSSWPASSAATCCRPPSASTARPASSSTPDDGLFAGIEREQPVWMSHGDSITRLPEGLPSRPPRPTRRRSPASRRPDRNLYGIQFHPEVVHTPARPGRPAQLRARHRRRRRRPGPPRTSSTRPSPASASGSIAHAARDGLRRQGHLRAVGRRRLRRRGRPRPSRGRRPADLHLRRPRPDAQEGIGAAAGHVRARPRA